MVQATVKDITEKSTECPFFHQGGCPWDPQHPHSFDTTAFKKCPAFANGCPYKDKQIEKIKDCPAFKDNKCPFNGSHSIDLSKIKECPAFKDGHCPYTHIHSKKKREHGEMNEHVATEHIADKATRCPFFAKSHGGCPWAPNHPHSYDVSKIKDCPAFQNGGCPFKGVHTDKLKECPAFKDGHCPFSDGTHSINLARINECPAFKTGCPYSKLPHAVHDHSNMNEHVVTEHIATQSTKCPFFSQAHGGCPFDPNHPHAFDLSKVKECPAFKGAGGCPFSGVHTEKLKECPAFKEGCPFANSSKPIDISRIHECPAFKRGCPYSSLAESAGQTTPTTTTSTTTTTTTTTADQGTNAQQAATDDRDPAKCPFHHMHGKVTNPH